MATRSDGTVAACGSGAGGPGPFLQVDSGYEYGLAIKACYANCDQSTTIPLLSANDFMCFLNRDAAQDTRANCDSSTGTPLLTANDFVCFLNTYTAGCS